MSCVNAGSHRHRVQTEELGFAWEKLAHRVLCSPGPAEFDNVIEYALHVHFNYKQILGQHIGLGSVIPSDLLLRNSDGQMNQVTKQFNQSVHLDFAFPAHHMDHRPMDAANEPAREPADPEAQQATGYLTLNRYESMWPELDKTLTPQAGGDPCVLLR